MSLWEYHAVRQGWKKANTIPGEEKSAPVENPAGFLEWHNSK